MATPTVAADVKPAPEPAAAPAAPAGALASILAPVEPARPVKPIGSTASMAEESIGATGGSDTPAKESGRGGKPEHPVGALLRAFASRIGRTGTTNNIKRQHTITESRVSGNSSNTKSANQSQHDAKHHNIGQHRSARDAKVADLNNKIQQQHARNQKDVKASDTKAATSSSKDGRDVKNHRDAKDASTRAAKTDNSSRNGRDVKDSKDVKASSSDTSKKDQSSAAKTDTSSRKADSTAKDQAAPKTAPTPKDAPAKTDLTKKDTPAKASKDATDTKTAAPRPRTQSSREAGYRDGTRAGAVAGHVKAYRDGVQDGYGDEAAKYEAEKRRMDDAKAKNALKPDKPMPAPNTAPASGSTADLTKKPAVDLLKKPEPAATPAPKKDTVQPTKPAAKKTAPTESLRMQEDPAEGRGAVATKNTPPTTQPKMTATSNSTKDLAPNLTPNYDGPLVEPLDNIKVGADDIRFTADSGWIRGSASRAEIRTLKAFEGRMAAKVPLMQKVAEHTKTTRTKAADHAARARRLAEQARDVEGGARLVAKLDRLAEQADALRNKTTEIEKRALRGSEAVRALVANANVRHGGIYKAVCDSPLTRPAERAFYQDKEGS